MSTGAPPVLWSSIQSPGIPSCDSTSLMMIAAGAGAASASSRAKASRTERIAVPTTPRKPDVRELACMRAQFLTPMKAVLTDERPSGEGWVFERKLDGIRCLAVKDGGTTRLFSRNELSLDDRYPSI